MRPWAGPPAGPTSLECEAACHAARQARSGLGSAFRPAYPALRCEAAAQAAYRRMMRPRAGLPAGPHLAECGAACHAARQARSGLGSAFRPAYSALRNKAAARAAQCLPVIVELCNIAARRAFAGASRTLYDAAKRGRARRRWRRTRVAPQSLMRRCCCPPRARL
eukprot:scaffold47165_cov88-Phaeocystis_antarctica.AAC.1